MFTISMIDANDFYESVTLDSTSYKLHFSWNGKNWCMDLRDQKNVDIIRNIAVVPNFPLLLQHTRHTKIKGQLLAIVNDNSTTIGRKDFINGRAKLVYMTLEDLNNAME
jgi:hypothetical protein